MREMLEAHGHSHPAGDAPTLGGLDDHGHIHGHLIARTENKAGAFDVRFHNHAHKHRTGHSTIREGWPQDRKEAVQRMRNGYGIRRI